MGNPNIQVITLSAARVNCAAIERGKIRVHRHEIEIRVLEKGGKYLLKSSSAAFYLDTFNVVRG